MHNTKKFLIVLSVVAFALHLIWENAQAPLYGGFASFGEHFQICLWGTIGDVVITLVVYLLIGILKNDFLWAARLNAKDILALSVVGLFIAVTIEWRALLFDRWSYSAFMPIIPYLEVGLSPILQMAILLPLSIYIAKKILTRL